MKVPKGRPTIARRFNGGLRSLKPIESQRDERRHAFVRASSAAPAGLSRLVFTPTVKTVGYSLSSRWDLIYAAANLAPDLRAPAAVTISSRILAFLNLLICRTCADRRSHIRFDNS